MSNVKGNFKNVTWGRVKHRLKPILGTHFEEAERRVLAGTERVFMINDYSVVLLRQEGSELLVAGFDGNLEECAPLIIMQARNHGFKTVRAHVERRSHLRLLKRIGLPFQMVNQQRCKALNCDEFVIRLVL
ncbi:MULTISPECIES: hypothetical protein [Aliivibrio]|uniref:GNAT family N-acetyltransferase n=1 Tax=Aliivibrio finisterrensis TaxID=511998 RepID=A0A4Q5KWH0_9GAMM|nr:MULTISPECIES: hypothetical protein [Aliivibrio]MDD9178428.1 hypothetical protein [Aliivibrio sp. A6]RYU53323.1 hypothetical protein ERW57_04130 [Aliivibrio finisterrensis]RYU65830.1 hypothetical protein ERW53_04650 [Aliivibrio finisterrensis]RYU86621.1 hypothetical protein ERW52_05990 [Aliivibrio finisterrensis]